MSNIAGLGLAGTTGAGIFLENGMYITVAAPGSVTLTVNHFQSGADPDKGVVPLALLKRQNGSPPRRPACRQ